AAVADAREDSVACVAPALFSDVACNPEADARVGVVDRRWRAPGAARLRWRAGPGATAHHLHAAARVDPGGAGHRCATVAVVPAVGDPFADIALKIVHTECVWRERAHRRRSPVAVAIVLEGIAPATAAGRPVLAAGQVARARGRGVVTPGIAPFTAGAQGVFEFGFAWQPVALAADFGQPVNIGLGVAGADVHDRQVGRGRGAREVRTPDDAAAAHEVAAALVVGHREAAALGARAVAGGVDEAAELADADLVEREREATIEAEVAPRLLAVVGVSVVVRRTHAEAAMRHHDHLRPTPAGGGVGEALPGAVVAVMNGQVDAF